jgi:hypothetical protein
MLAHSDGYQPAHFMKIIALALIKSAIRADSWCQNVRTGPPPSPETLTLRPILISHSEVLLCVQSRRFPRWGLLQIRAQISTLSPELHAQTMSISFTLSSAKYKAACARKQIPYIAKFLNSPYSEVFF